VATIFVGVGMMSEFIFAMFFHWQTVSMILFVISVIGCGSLFLLPETPMWLRKQGRIREAEAAKKWLCEDRTAAATVVAANTIAAADDVVDVTRTGWRLVTEPIVWKPMLLTFTFFVCQQGSGFYVLLFYSVDMLKDSHVQWDGFTVTVFLSVARVVGSLVFSMLHHVRRKTLTVVSGCGMALSLVVIVSYIHMYRDVTDPPYGILQIFAFIMYMFFALLAMLPLPWIICGEIFPMSIKGSYT
jgi:SP family facilitated glucose transporter-like MFS transporter 8